MQKVLLLPLILGSPLVCLACEAGEATPSPGAANGIEGVISAGPVHGGPSRQGVADSRPLANMAFEVKQGARVIASFQTDDRGHFRVFLSPGHYTIKRKDYSSAVGSYGPFEVDVSQGKMVSVQWTCDTGLR